MGEGGCLCAYADGARGRGKRVGSTEKSYKAQGLELIELREHIQECGVFTYFGQS